MPRGIASWVVSEGRSVRWRLGFPTLTIKEDREDAPASDIVCLQGGRIIVRQEPELHSLGNSDRHEFFVHHGHHRFQPIGNWLDHEIQGEGNPGK